MPHKKALIIGIVGGSTGGLLGGYFGNIYGLKFGFNPYLIAFVTGVLAVGIAVILANIFK